ncbi:MAG: anion permease [Thermodesulfovibrionales bacterium]|nr:anion permease [Thermodesulfovibrionales bacterium]
MFEIAIIASLCIAFGIGSNDASNAFGVCIGAGLLKIKKAFILFGILVLLGIFLQGSKVMKTVGKNLVDVNTSILTISLCVASFLIVFSNWRKLPLSTHQVIIGSLIGAGFANDVYINTTEIIKIVISWIVSPIAAIGFSFLIFKALEKTISKLPTFFIERFLRTALLISAGLISYNTGANELATVLGPLMHSGIEIDKTLIFLSASIMVFLGAYLLSHRVIETVGKGITVLDPYSGFAAQLGAGGCVLLFTILGMPVSTTYSIIGGIIGVGLNKGIKTVKLNLILKIGINFIVSPSLAFIISYLFLKLTHP